MLSSHLDKFAYDFPPELIAQRPAEPRDAARLLSYDRKTGERREATFAELADYLPPHAVIVFNETKVIPARLTLKKTTGGKVNVIYLGFANGEMKTMADRKLDIGATLATDGDDHFTVTRHDERFWFLRPEFPATELIAVLERRGTAPLPPYIKHTPLTAEEVKREYQAVFARNVGSVAAPTASLHFTDELLDKLRAAGFGIEFVTLHVNLGTFAPLTEEQLASGKLHTEAFEIAPATAERLNAAKSAGRPIVAVGTTVMRTLESAADDYGRLTNIAGETSIFIRDGYRFKFVDALITNFHVPSSSLLMLVAAFAGYEETMSLYQYAVEQKYRLFSFGDGMLIK